MPIIGLVDQPFVESIHAAYRPINFLVYAKRTDGQLIPPVVYCDIYIRGIYYKTISKTQYYLVTNTESQWKFDIQDALQEYLGKYISDNGKNAIEEVTDIIADVFCKFRSSGFDANGFIQTENTAPIQGTSNTSPVPGTGLVSNTFYVLNSSLQHEDNQNLATHLNAYKNRTWDGTTYPLTHRPEGYRICRNDSDTFPILTNKTPINIVLHYLPKNSSNWQQTVFNAPCDPWIAYVPIVPGNINLPNGSLGVPYSFTIQGDKSVLLTFTNVVKPAWMTIAQSGSDIVFSGTPDVSGGPVNISFDVSNCPGQVAMHYASTVTIACTPISFTGVPSLPDAIENSPYNVTLPFQGSQPFTLSAIVKPAWMDMLVFGGNVLLFGTPMDFDVADNVHVSFSVDGPCGLSYIIDTHIDVLSAAANAYQDKLQYSIYTGAITGQCDVTININRTDAAKNSSIPDKVVRVHFYVQSDNGCDLTDYYDMNPGAGAAAIVRTTMCGTGPCGSSNAIITSIEVI